MYLPLESADGKTAYPDGRTPETSAEEQHEILRSIQAFQEWLGDLQQNAMVSVVPGSSIVQVLEPATNTFCVGIVEGRIFLGIHRTQMQWFCGLPWLHVAIRRGSRSLNFVCEEATVQGITVPYFALAFKLGSGKIISMLQRYHFLDVREVEIDAEGHIDSVSTAVLTTIRIVLVDDDRNVRVLLAGRGGRTFSNRSIFRS